MSDETRGTAADGDAVWIAAARQLAGEGTAEERDAFRRQAEAHPGREALLASLDAVLMPLDRDARPDVDVEAALAAVLARRDAGPRLIESDDAGSREMTPRGAGDRKMAPPPSIARGPRWLVRTWL